MPIFSIRNAANQPTIETLTEQVRQNVQVDSQLDRDIESAINLVEEFRSRSDQTYQEKKFTTIGSLTKTPKSRGLHKNSPETLVDSDIFVHGSLEDPYHPYSRGRDLKVEREISYRSSPLEAPLIVHRRLALSKQGHQTMKAMLSKGKVIGSVLPLFTSTTYITARAYGQSTTVKNKIHDIVFHFYAPRGLPVCQGMQSNVLITMPGTDFLVRRVTKGMRGATHVEADLLQTNHLPDPRLKLPGAMVLAVKQGDTATVKDLVDAGADINALDLEEYFQTPIQIAVQQGHPDIAQILIDAGAKFHPNDCLQTSIEHGNLSLVNIFLKSGGDMKKVLSQCPNIFTTAIKKGNEKIVQMLLEAGANVDSRKLSTAIRGGHEKIVDRLIQAGADVNHASTGYYPPLHEAIMKGNERMVRLLIKAGADIHQVNLATKFEHKTPLFLAAKQGYPRIVQTLIKAGADVNHFGQSGDSNDSRILHVPLIAAAKNNNIEIVRMLLDAGANKDQKESKSGWTAAQYAEYNDCTEIASLINFY